MTSATEIQTRFRNFAAMIESLPLHNAAFTQRTETADALQVERGIVFPLAMIDRPVNSSIDRVLELGSSSRLGNVAIVDASGHQRPAYRGLLVYSCLSAFRLLYEKIPRSEFGRWEESLRSWCDLLEADLTNTNWPQGVVPASWGSSASAVVWNALALYAAGKIFIRDPWTDLAGDVFGKLTRAQQPDGSFFSASASDNPETHWYHELVTLHAATSYAVQSANRSLAAAVARNAVFHQNQTQPDHASRHPWGVFAFIWNVQTHPLAEQVLHSAKINAAAADDAIALMLLADALYCLRLFF